MRTTSCGRPRRNFLDENPRFVADRDIDAKLGVTGGPGIYLRCIAD